MPNSNTKYKFRFDPPLGYKVVTKEDYPRYHIDEDTTVEVMIKFDGERVRSISINRDDVFHSEEEFIELVDLNMKNMKKLGMKVQPKETLDLPNGRRVVRLYSAFKGLKYVTYFSNIRDIMIAASVEIDNANDESEQDLLTLFSSIKEE